MVTSHATQKSWDWSYWSCGITHSSLKDQEYVAITTTANRILLPPSQFIVDKTYKWSKIPGYNCLSPELVLFVFSGPLSVTPGQVLRLWYGEDFVNNASDNSGTCCCDVFARFMLSCMICLLVSLAFNPLGLT